MEYLLLLLCVEKKQRNQPPGKKRGQLKARPRTSLYNLPQKESC